MIAVTALDSPRSAPALDHRPWIRALIGGTSAILFATLIFGFVRWLAGLAPATPWVGDTALAVHLATVIPAVPLGAYVLLAKKGGPRHRMLGKLWLGLMFATAVATLFVRNINDGQFSWIHIFSLMTFAAVPQAILTARRRDFVAHRNHMLLFFSGSLIIAGAFTFLPGRMMWQWAFGDPRVEHPSHG